MMKLRTTLTTSLVLASALLLTACGKATLRQGASAEGFTLASLRQGSPALIVDAEVATSGFTPPYQEAFNERFGTGDSLSSYLAARLLDSLNRGKPKVAATAAPALGPRYLLIVRDLMLARGARELPTALLPTGGQQTLQAAGGGTSEAWTFSFVVNVWETSGQSPEDTAGLKESSETTPGADSRATSENAEANPAADTLNGLLRYSFAVTGSADVPLYAYKKSLVEAVNAAAAKAARHLRGQ